MPDPTDSPDPIDARPRTPRLIRLNDVPKLKWLPRRRAGTRLAVATVHRWANPGRRVHLKTVRVGGTRCTSAEWLRQFFAASSDAATGPVPAHARRTPARRNRDQAAAMAGLAAAGIA